MQDLTLIIPTKKEVESLPIFLKEIENYNCKKLIVLEKEDIETKKILEKFNDINILEQKSNGYGNALIEGINNTETDFCCIINADGSMDPKYLEEMRKLNIGVGVHYTSLHLHPYYKKKYNYKIGDFPIAEKFYYQEISLPIYYSLKKLEVYKIAKYLKEYCN